MSIYLSALLFGIMLSIPQTAYESQTVISTLSSTTQNELPYVQQVVEAKKAPPIPPALHEIAECESHGQQFDKDGTVLRGDENPDDVGKYQINEHFWGKEAKNLGFDLYTEEGNEAMALELYHRFGTNPWNWSKHCWQK